MDLANTEGKVFIKNNTTPDFKQIAKAVINAGFSVRFIRILTDLSASANCFTINGNTFQWIAGVPLQSTSVVDLTLIGEEFMPKKKATTALKKKPEPCISGKPIYYVSIR